MKQEVTNFARFYASFNRLPCAGDREDFKKSVVLQYTWNRTDSLREMTRKEYEDCCTALEKMTGYKAELKKKRSVCLKLMQRIGVDTGDWVRINNFCQHPKIAGKAFARLSAGELDGLQVKLRAIERKGGLKTGEKTKGAGATVAYFVNMDNVALS